MEMNPIGGGAVMGSFSLPRNGIVKLGLKQNFTATSFAGLTINLLKKRI